MTRDRGAPDGPGPALVSVVMPVRDEGAFIERSLGAVLRQTYEPTALEIIVADGMSTDGTREIVERLRRERPLLRMVDNPRGIVATGLNRAIAAARGSVVVRVDGHCEVAPDYVAKCVAHLDAGEADGVGGPVETVGETPIAQAIAAAMSSPFGVGNSAFRTRKDLTAFVDTVPFPAYRREVLEREGPYDEELVRNQDDEYNYRLRSYGGRVLLARDVNSRYYSRATLRSLFRQYFQYGYWKVRVLQKHPRQMMPRQFVPAVALFGLVASVLAGLFSRWPLVLVLGAASVYALAALWAAARALRGRSKMLLPAVVAAFAVLHVSYGAGFWRGLAVFRARWRARRPELQRSVSAWPSAPPSNNPQPVEENDA